MNHSVSSVRSNPVPDEGAPVHRSGYYDYSAGVQDEGDGDEIGLQQLVGIVKRQWKLLAGISFGTFAATVGVALILTPTYSGTTILKVDPSFKPLVSGNQADVPQAAEDQSVLGTETGIIQSRTIARQVIESLHLASVEEFAPKHPDRLPSDEARREAVVDNFLKALTVKRDTDNYLINVTFAAQDRELSARVANAVSDAYVASTIVQRSQMAAAQAKWLSERLDKLGGEVQKAESLAAQYKARAGIVQSTTLGTVTDQQIGPIASSLAQAEQEEHAARSELATAREQVARGNIGSINGVLNSPVITDLRRQRAEASKELADVETRYGPKHPEYQRVREMIGNLDHAINDETARIVEGLKAKAQSASSQAAGLRANLNQVKAEQSGNAQSAAYADAYDRDAKAKQTTYEELAHKLEQASQAQHDQLPSAQIVERAVPSVLPTFPNIPLFCALGLVLGSLLGFVTVFIRDLSNKAIRFSDDLAKASGAHVIVSIPALTKKELTHDGQSISPSDVILQRPISAYAECFRTLRSSIMLSAQPPKILATLSALPGDGKSTVSMSLALAMASSNDKVLLIDCDLRRGQVARLVNKKPTVGLVEVLLGRSTWQDAILRDVEHNLDILPISGNGFTTADLFSGGAMQDLLQQLRGDYDFILLDTPPLLAVSDSRIIASLVDASIFVSASNKTPRGAVQAAIDMLKSDHSPLLGTVLSMVDLRSRASSRSNDPSYYFKEYSTYVESK